MNRQEALAHILTLAANNLPADGNSHNPNYRYVLEDMDQKFFFKYEQWFNDNKFFQEII
jgi:hypothetical protein